MAKFLLLYKIKIYYQCMMLKNEASL